MTAFEYSRNRTIDQENRQRILSCPYRVLQYVKLYYLVEIYLLNRVEAVISKEDTWVCTKAMVKTFLETSLDQRFKETINIYRIYLRIMRFLLLHYYCFSITISIKKSIGITHGIQT